MALRCKKAYTSSFEILYQRLKILSKVVPTALGNKFGKKVLKKKILLNMIDKNYGPVSTKCNLAIAKNPSFF